MKKRFSTVLVILLIIPMLLASTATVPPINAQELTEVRIGDMPYSVFAALRWADAEGYFADVGLRAEFKLFTSGIPMVQSFAAGELDIAPIGAMPMLLAADGDLFDVEAVAAITEVMGILFLIAVPPISTFEELVGKTIAVAKGTNNELVFNLLVSKYGYSLDDFNIVSMELPEIAAALIAEQVDAGTPHLTGAYELITKYAYNTVATGLDLDQPPNPIYLKLNDIIIINGEWGRENPRLVEKVLSVYWRAIDYWLAHESEMIEWARDNQNKQLGTELTKEYYSFYWSGFTKETFQDNVERWFNRSYAGNLWNGIETLAEFNVELGRLTKVPDLDKLINETYVEDLSNMEQTAATTIEEAGSAIKDATKVGGDVTEALDLLEEAEVAYQKLDYFDAFDLASRSTESAESAKAAAIAAKNQTTYIIIGIAIVAVIGTFLVTWYAKRKRS